MWLPADPVAAGVPVGSGGAGVAGWPCTTVERRTGCSGVVAGRSVWAVCFAVDGGSVMIPDPIPAVPYLRVVGSLDAVEPADTVAGLAATYSRLADELAAMVEAENERAAHAHAVIAAALGELHTELDELAARIARGGA